MRSILLLLSALPFLFSEMTNTLPSKVPSTYLTSAERSQQDLSKISYGKIIEHTVFDMSFHQLTANLTSQEPLEFVSIKDLLEFPQRFHKKMVAVRGIIAQPEMHLDDTELFFNFVFLLKEGENSLVVFGQHDRTQGGSSIAMGNTVQVTGIFWKDRIAHEYHFKNNLEALTVTPYPSLIPNRT